MTHDTDICIAGIELDFGAVMLDRPLALSKGVLSSVSQVRVRTAVRTRGGATGTGTATSMLSVMWAWPTGARTWDEKSAACREMCQAIRAALCNESHFLDPFQFAVELSHLGTSLTERLGAPELVAPLVSGVFDSSIHDAWGKASHRSCYDMYGRTCLNHDLGFYLGPDFDGLYPSGFLRDDPLRDLPIQAVVGLGDAPQPEPGRPSVKIKIDGQQPRAALERICDVHGAFTTTGAPRLCIDANESFASAREFVAFLDVLRQRSALTYGSVEYWEQPLARTWDGDLSTLSATNARIVLDEGLPDVFARRPVRGGMGRALKTFRGQTQCLLHYCVARRLGGFVTMQDLTNVDVSLLQAAHLSSFLHLDVQDFECNSLEYAPTANRRLLERHPGLVDDQTLRLPRAAFAGLSGL